MENNMKNITISLFASLLFSLSALADTVAVTTIVEFETPDHTASSTMNYGFKPSAPIKFSVAGKTCKWVSSSSPYGSGGGAGCNYSIQVDADGGLSNATSNGNGCTASGSAMIDACK